MSAKNYFGFLDEFSRAVIVVNSKHQILYLNQFFKRHYPSSFLLSEKQSIDDLFLADNLISSVETMVSGNFSFVLSLTLRNPTSEKKNILVAGHDFFFLPETFLLIETARPDAATQNMLISTHRYELTEKKMEMEFAGVSLSEILGYNRDEFSTLDFFSLIHRDDVDEAMDKFYSSIKRKSEAVVLTGRFQKKSGEYSWVENTLHFAYDGGNPETLRVRTTSRDVSDIVATREELFNLKEYLEEAQNLAKIGNWQLNLDTEELSWPPTMARIYEHDPDKSPRTGGEFFRFVHPDDYDYVGLRYRELFELTHQDYSGYKEIQFRIITGKGNLKYIKARFKLGPAQRSVSGINIDVTVEVENEIKLKQSESNYYHLVENFPLGVGVTKNHSRAYVNKKLAELFELSPEEFIKYPLDAFANDETGLLLRNRIAAMVKGEKVSNYFTGTFITTKSQQIKTLEIHTSEVTWEGEPARLALVIDITELKAHQEKIIQSENMLRLAQEFAGITSWQVKLPTNALQSNELVDTMFEKRIHQDDRGYAYQTFKKCQEGLAPYDVEFRLATDSGKIQWVAEKGNVIKNADGKATEMYGVTRDITNEKIREQQLLQAKNMAEEAYKNQETFFSFMSHEIRTPLNAILGLTNLLSGKQSQKNKSEIVKTLKNAGDNLMHVVDGLLDLTKSKTGNNTAAIVDFKLSDTLYQLESSYRFLAREKGIGFVLVIDPNIPGLLRGDVVKLYQVLNNLLDNAIKFTQQGFVSLSVVMQKQNKNKFLFEFRIEDTGIGIPSDKIDQLFKPFHQLTFDTRIKGTGLGLAIVKNLVNQLHGTITIESEPDNGSVFTLTVPFELGSKVSIAKIKKDYRPLKGKKILYVEDVDTNQYLIQNLLREYRAKCDVASTGKQALILLAKKKYDLLLLDIQLPDISGYELLEIAQSTLRSKSIPVLIFTADATEGTKIKIQNYGIKDIVYKPFISDDLLAKIIKVTKTSEGITMDYYERLFRGNKTKLEKVKELVMYDLDDLRRSLMKNVKAGDVAKIKKSIHKPKVAIKNINALKLLKLIEVLESRKSITPYFLKKYRATQRELMVVKKKLAALTFK